MLDLREAIDAPGAGGLGLTLLAQVCTRRADDFSCCNRDADARAELFQNLAELLRAMCGVGDFAVENCRQRLAFVQADFLAGDARNCQARDACRSGDLCAFGQQSTGLVVGGFRVLLGFLDRRAALQEQHADRRGETGQALG